MNAAVQLIAKEAAAMDAMDEKALADQWLRSFEAALNGGNQAAIAALFAPDSHWRDLVAFTWSITSRRSATDIAALLHRTQPATKAGGFAVAEGHTPPRRIQRSGIDVIEAIFRFETAVGRGYGVLRLLADDPARAFQISTNVQELKGFEENVGKRRPTGDAFSRNFGGTNWQDQRIAAQAYSEREPTVLIVGGGQGGLTLAARLVRLGVDTLIIDRNERIGDNWRKRYHSLALHNNTDINHMPYMPFPPSWPTYLPKDMLADWFESYAWAMELNFWTSTEIARGSYDQATGKWTVVVRKADGTERTLRPAHLVMATGVVGDPRIPDLPGLKDYQGTVQHSAHFTNGAEWHGKRVMVVGTGTSAHDVAQDLHSNGAETTIVQRGSTTVISINPSARLIHAVYDGLPLDDADLIVSSSTLPVARANLQRIVERQVAFDRKMIDGLIARGFKWDIGEDKAGHNMKIRRRFGGYYLDAGCAQLIIDGKIALVQYDTIERFVPEGVLFKDGTVRPYDLIVLATGFDTQQKLVAQTLGEDIADKVGKIWGLRPDGELNNMWRRTAQPGLWFMGGGFANVRVNSRHLALQIKAIEEGLLSKQLDPADDPAAYHDPAAYDIERYTGAA